MERDQTSFCVEDLPVRAAAASLVKICKLMIVCSAVGSEWLSGPQWGAPQLYTEI